jgi:hypothetical protein
LLQKTSVAKSLHRATYIGSEQRHLPIPFRNLPRFYFSGTEGRQGPLDTAGNLTETLLDGLSAVAATRQTLFLIPLRETLVLKCCKPSIAARASRNANHEWTEQHAARELQPKRRRFQDEQTATDIIQTH